MCIRDRLFCGDITGIGSRPKGTPYGEFCTVEAMSEALKKLQPRFAEIDGVFPGHGAWDQSPLILQYLLDLSLIHIYFAGNGKAAG